MESPFGPKGITWREFLGFLRDDSVLLFRLMILVGELLCGVGAVIAAVLADGSSTILFLVAMAAVACVGLLSTRSWR